MIIKKDRLLKINSQLLFFNIQKNISFYSSKLVHNKMNDDYTVHVMDKLRYHIAQYKYRIKRKLTIIASCETTKIDKQLFIQEKHLSMRFIQ